MALMTTVMLRDTLANRPAAASSNAGWRFIQTDGEGAGEYASDGTTWNKIKTAMALIIAVGDETTAITAGAGKFTFRMPFAFTLIAVRASLKTAQSSGSIFTVDLNDSGTTVLSTKLTIDNGEKTSTTAATAAVISDSALADDSEISVDVDQIGDGTAVGLRVTLIGVRS